MDIVPIYRRVIGLDVHQAQITGCAITEQPDGSVTYERREFGGFKRDRKALAEWARAIGPDVVVMESTGIYWKSPYAALEREGIIAWVVKPGPICWRSSTTGPATGPPSSPASCLSSTGTSG